MPRLFGIPVSDDDARRLIATLLADGTPDALTAAVQITKGVERDLYAVGLTPAERTAVLACLEDPPTPSWSRREDRDDDHLEVDGRLQHEPRQLARQDRLRQVRQGADERVGISSATLITSPEPTDGGLRCPWT